MSTHSLPPSVYADLSSMTPKELRLAQEEIWTWLELAESAPLSDAPNDDLMEQVRDKLNAIIAERRALHSDEPAPRGG